MCQQLLEIMSSRDQELEWPPYSPDLTPCDNFLWAYLKEKVYENGKRFNDINSLKQKIIEVMQNIPQDLIFRSVDLLKDVISNKDLQSININQ